MARRKKTSVRRRKSVGKGFNTNIMLDVGLAGLATRVLPLVVNKFFPLDPTLYSLVGGGGTFVVGNFMKKPVMANAGIALAGVELLAPMIENVIGGIGVGTTGVPSSITGAVNTRVISKSPSVPVTLADFRNIRLNEYVGMPSEQSYPMYSSSY